MMRRNNRTAGRKLRKQMLERFRRESERYIWLQNVTTLREGEGEWFGVGGSETDEVELEPSIPGGTKLVADPARRRLLFATLAIRLPSVLPCYVQTRNSTKICHVNWENVQKSE